MLQRTIELLVVILVMVSSPVSAEDITLRYRFESPRIEYVNLNGVIYARITIPQLSNSGNPGEPSLPASASRVLIPFGMEVKDVEVTADQEISIGIDYRIEPEACPVPLSAVTRNYPPLIPNPAVYNSSESFPKRRFKNIGIQSFRGYQILILRLHPIQYRPDVGELLYNPGLTVRLELAPSSKSIGLFRGLSSDLAEIQDRVDNPEYSLSYQPYLKGDNESCDLLILIAPELASSFLPLKNYHDSTGAATEIITTADIGSADPTVIRDYVRDRYLNDGLNYLLIGGDDHLIPAPDLFSCLTHWSDSASAYVTDTIYDMPGDFFFGCLDGDFNYDGDAILGEPGDGIDGGEVDLTAEVFVGRVPADNAEEVAKFLSKAFRYLNSAKSEYLKKVLLAGEHLGFGGIAEFAEPYMEEFVDSSDAHGYATIGFSSEKYDIDRLYDSRWPGFSWPGEEIISRINRQPHIVNHLGHANTHYALKLYKPVLLSEFSNFIPCFLYSQGCMAGGFDDLNCWAEYATVKAENATFAAIMNARYGLGKALSTDGVSQRYAREFWDAIYNPLENKPQLGRANCDSKEDNIYRIDQGGMRWVFFGLNLFGDPAMEIKRGWLDIGSFQFIEAAGDGDSTLESGERIEAIFTVTNYMYDTIENVTVELAVNDASIDLLDNQTSIGTLLPNVSISNNSDPFVFEIPSDYGSRIDTFLYIIKWNNGICPDTVAVTQQIGEAIILLVQDDYPNDYSAYFTECLDKTSIPYSIFTRSPLSRPDSSLLANHEIVIWFTGDRLVQTSPTDPDLIEFEEEPLLQEYLDSNGKLFLTGQHLAYQLSNSSYSFLTDYLMSQYLSSLPSGSLEAVDGAGVFLPADMVSLSGAGSAENQIAPDQISPCNSGIGELCYVGTTHLGAVSYAGDYRLVFMPFGFEAITDDGLSGINRDMVLSRVLDFLGCDKTSQCPGILEVSLPAENLERVVSHTPAINWVYVDNDGDSQQKYQLQVGSDNDWSYAEMWDSGPLNGALQTETYDGVELVNGERYYLRLRVFDGQFWSGWEMLNFDMNTEPGVPTNLWPSGGQSIREDSLVFSHELVLDAESDSVTYDYEIYTDTSLTELLECAYDRPGSQAGRTEWVAGNSLLSGNEYSWRVRSGDDYEKGSWSSPASFVVVPVFVCGDANRDGSVNVGDAVFLVNLIFHDGTPPNPVQAGDVNCDDNLNVGDAVYLLNFVFKGNAPEPCAACQ